MNLLSNYLKVATRNINRQRLHTIINVFGLSMGLAFSLFIYAFVLHEQSFDNFHEKGDRIYFYPMTWHFNGTVLPAGANCSVAGPFAKDVFPEVETFVRISLKSLSFRKADEVIKENNVYFTDSTFFQVFTFPLIQGESNRTLKNPYSVVLTRKSAEKYFGPDWESQNLVGQTLETNVNRLYTITGVAENPSVNSHLQFDFLVSINSLPPFRTMKGNGTWDSSDFYTYLLVHPNADVNAIRQAFPAQLDNYFGEKTNETIELHLIPLKDVYLHSTVNKALNASNKVYVQIFSLIALLILVVATVNYINLATAHSINRAAEVGIRKVLGSTRFQLFYQFLGESFLLTTISFILALLIASLGMPYFSILIDRPLQIKILSEGFIPLLILLAGVIIGVLAGLYPALILSGYEPVKVLKGKLKDSVTGLRIRKALVVSQFLISITLIICTLTVSSQLRFIRQKDSGYDRQQLVSLTLDSLARTQLPVLKAQLRQQPKITGTAATYQLPINLTWQTALGLKSGKDEDRILMHMCGVDSEYARTLGLTFIAGTDLKPDVENVSETWEILLNESAASTFGWSPGEAVGQELRVWETEGVVKGVVKDFHFSSLHSPIAPLVIISGPWARNYGQLLVRMNGTPKEINEILELSWKTTIPDSPFLLTFINDQYDNLYKKEKQLGWIINLFAGLAIAISSLGMFGLASYSILQRTKELGVRKVLGASANSLLGLVASAFIKPVGIAFLIASLLSGYVMNQWLNGFAYHISFSWLVVLLAGVISITLVLLTIAYHLFQVVKLNPSETLRSE